jgi:hypothetical protein
MQKSIVIDGQLAAAGLSCPTAATRAGIARLKQVVVGLVLTLGLIVGLAAFAPQAANAAPPASGIVAEHRGSWGYHEVVFGKATTRAVAESGLLGGASLVAGYLSIYLMPAALLGYLWQNRAQAAVSRGQCLAAVSSRFMGPGSYPGITSQGCR